MSTLYARIDDKVYESLRAVAAEAGLSIAMTAEVITAQTLGHGHRLWPLVGQAVRAHKREEAQK